MYVCILRVEWRKFYYLEMPNTKKNTCCYTTYWVHEHIDFNKESIDIHWAFLWNKQTPAFAIFSPAFVTGLRTACAADANLAFAIVKRARHLNYASRWYLYVRPTTERRNCQSRRRAPRKAGLILWFAPSPLIWCFCSLWDSLSFGSDVRNSKV